MPPAVEAVFNDNVFRDAVVAMSALMESITLQFTPDGIRAKGVDSSYISMCYFFLDSDDLHTYTCSVSADVGVNPCHLAAILKASGKEHRVTLRYGDGSSMLDLSVTHQEDKSSFDYSIHTMDIEDSQLDIPEMAFDATHRMSVTSLKHIVQQMTGFGSDVYLYMNNDGTIFRTQGDLGKAEMTLAREEQRSVTQMACNRYALRYLALFCKVGTSMGNEVTLRQSTDAPLQLDFGPLIFLLASKMSD